LSPWQPTVEAKEFALNLNLQIIFWMVALLYLMLHTAIW
jgi:hypothetical protein